ncbi:MAG: crossover junction endodeoxyribonuclease RuvC, partial [Oscillospiraceae bacterium]|nr:crossover junction endodeoxyribonuclease RuvC [Oscillospiraceae bacterium]
MITLGIDPGLATVGFGLLESHGGGRLQHLRHGAVTTRAHEKLEDRLRVIYEDIAELIETFRPGHIAIEELYFGKNVTTGLPVAHARGVILLAAARANVPVFVYKPMQIKQSVVGYGKA